MALPSSSFAGRSVHAYRHAFEESSVTASPEGWPFASSCTCTPACAATVLADSALPSESSHCLLTETVVVSGLGVSLSNLPWNGRV